MGLRILIVEDEMTIAMMIEDMLLELGHEVAGVASRLARAQELASSGDFDLAIVDVNLGGQLSTPVARALAARSRPFFFATGYGAAGVDPDFANTLVLGKPFMIRDLEQAINKTAA